MIVWTVFIRDRIFLKMEKYERNIDALDRKGSSYESATCFYTNTTASGGKVLDLDYPAADYCEYNCADEGFKYALYDVEQDKDG